MAKFDDVVKRVVQEQLAPAQIVELTVEEAEDADGDPEKVLGPVRHLRKPLNKLGTDRFPVLSFMTSKEASDATT